MAVNAKGPFLDPTGTKAAGKLRLGRTGELTCNPWCPQRPAVRAPLPLYKYYGYSIHMCRPIQGKGQEKTECEIRRCGLLIVMKWVGRDFSGPDRPPSKANPPSPYITTGFILFYFALADSGTQGLPQSTKYPDYPLQRNHTCSKVQAAPRRRPYSSYHPCKPVL